MKNLDLNAYGVKEMSQQEMLNENGGWWQVAVGILVAVAIYVATDFDDIKQGAQDANDGKEYDYQRCGC